MVTEHELKSISQEITYSVDVREDKVIEKTLREMSVEIARRLRRNDLAGLLPLGVVESLAIARAKALFGAEHANVQPHSGAQANMAVYFTIVKPGDTVFAPSCWLAATRCCR